MTTATTAFPKSLKATFNVREAAEVIGCSERHVKRMRDAWLMPQPISIGGGNVVRFRASQIYAWLEQGCPACPPAEQQESGESLIGS
jgi:predicted DNA-binding transcriptional regulator AlpA